MGPLIEIRPNNRHERIDKSNLLLVKSRIVAVGKQPVEIPTDGIWRVKLAGHHEFANEADYSTLVFVSSRWRVAAPGCFEDDRAQDTVSGASRAR